MDNGEFQEPRTRPEPAHEGADVADLPAGASPLARAQRLYDEHPWVFVGAAVGAGVAVGASLRASADPARPRAASGGMGGGIAGTARSMLVRAALGYVIERLASRD